jgi:diguanylate cyclase (GGDEF)-like protein
MTATTHPLGRSFRRQIAAVNPVWVLNIAMAVATALLYVFSAHSLGPLTEPHLPWWALALGFAAGERAVVHLHFRQSAHSFSLGEVPLVFGLIFGGAPGLVLGRVIGTAVPLLLDRRLPPVKVAFNLAQFALTACVAEMTLHALAGADSSLGPTMWMAVLVAVESSALLTVSLISAAIAISEGKLPRGKLSEMFTMDLGVTVTNTSLALVAAIIVSTDARAVPLILIPATTVFSAYRAYLAERQRHERLEFLYEATRTLSRSPEVVMALEGLLTRSLEAFRVELAEIVLFSVDGQPPLRTSLTVTGEKEVMVPLDRAIADDIRELVEAEGPAASLRAPFGSEALQRYMDERGVTHAMVATLPGDERIVGALMLANRLGVVRAFDAEDLKLFEALANNTSVALQFDRLEQSVWQLRELQEQLQHQAFHDPLTNLANRSLFVNQVKDALARREGSIAVLFIDVDDFKTVNDTLGHAVGDELLMAIARRLHGCVLPSDTIARLGGDEFAILLQHIGDSAEAGKAVADRIVHALNDPLSVGGRMSPVKVSIGIATGRPGLEHADEVIRNADVAMYHAKRGGKGRAAVFELSMRAAVLERHGLKSDLERALEREQLRVEYQPIFSLADDRLTAVEALVRWDRHDGGPVLPSEFVPLAEETGLIGQLGEFVLAEACLQARSWRDGNAFGSEVAVHVNVSAVELEDARLVPRVADVLDQTGLPPHLLVLEVTESAVLRDAIRGTTTLTELQDIGVRLALDDFGTGYSSLSYLRTLPLDMLKVARPFIESITLGPQEASFLRMINELGGTLGLQVVAEGIETTDQLLLVRSLGCELAQGFLLGRPTPPHDLTSIEHTRALLARSARSSRRERVGAA